MELCVITCHTGSCNVTCHPTQVSKPCLIPRQTDRDYDITATEHVAKCCIGEVCEASE